MAFDLAKVVAQAAAWREEAKALEAKANELLDTLGDLPLRDYPAGDFILRVQPNRRFDPATAKKNLTQDQYASILKPTPNAALAKALLDEDYALCQRDYDPKRVIVRVSDLDSEG